MKKILGMELGSTRIKAVLIDEKARVLASGSHGWENTLLPGGIWSYTLADAVAGMQDAYAKLKADFAAKTGGRLTSLDAAGISGMMHGYLPFSAAGEQLADFRTWRCTVTAPAAAELSRAFRFNMPQRWSASFFYQALKDDEPRVREVARLTTLGGYIHGLLTGCPVMSVGEASGMFPIDPATNTYDAAKLAAFRELSGVDIRPLLPDPRTAGEPAGTLTPEGARLLDPTGELRPGAVFAPPEGDVQTGMVATNAVAPRRANISAGTSIFAVVILEKALQGYYPEIDVVASPTGKAAAMSHANTCTSDINAWVDLLGGDYAALFRESLKGDPDCGGVVTVPYLSGEPITHFAEGMPLVARRPGAKFTLANFMRANIYSAFATMKLGLDILAPEGVRIDSVTGHGGIFKDRGIAQQYLADCLGTPVTCLDTAGEGGPWGMALLAAYRAERAAGAPAGDKSFEEYLDGFFAGAGRETLRPLPDGAAGFAKYMESFRAALAAERSLVP